MLKYAREESMNYLKLRPNPDKINVLNFFVRFDLLLLRISDIYFIYLF